MSLFLVSVGSHVAVHCSKLKTELSGADLDGSQTHMPQQKELRGCLLGVSLSCK